MPEGRREDKRMKMLIGDKMADASDGGTIGVTNPATNELVDVIPMATPYDINKALDNAKKGQREWRNVALIEKEKIFERFYAILQRNKSDVIETLMLESGNSIRNALFQFNGITELFKGYIETAKRYDGHILVPGTESGHDGDTSKDLQMIVYEPIGTVLAIVPFNAPLMLFAYKVAPALAAGNAVIVKPPTSNPLALLKVASMLREAGVPGKALQVITGNGIIVGKYLVKDPRVDAVTLTGSTEVGIEIASILAKRLAPCGLELGGNDPFIVLEDAYDIKEAAKLAAFWRFNSSGQICISPKRFIVQNSVKREFTQAVLDFADGIEMGYGYDVKSEVAKYIDTPFSDFKPGKMLMNCLISENAAKTVESQINHTIVQGANLLKGGKRKGAFIEPTVLGDVTADMDVAKDMEIFGPVFPIIGVDSVDEAIKIANSSCFGLSGCVMTSDWKKGMRVASEVDSGEIIVNGSPTYRNMMQPFGGHKMSGLGPREGFFTLGEMVQEKVIVFKGFLP
jgi:succinate-semialdehyde dehydrogenase/glutarate-semialdehyde dehydrogenase